VEQSGVSISALLTYSFYLLSLNYRKNKETKESAAFAGNGRKIGAEEEDEDQTGGSSPTVTAHLCWRVAPHRKIPSDSTLRRDIRPI
jgi:hypothetical protein